MADDTPQRMIDAEKRKLQKQAVPRMDPGFDVGQEIFETEMEAAEAKGDLPPATVSADSYEAEVIRSMEGGETPTQAAETYGETIDRREEKGRAIGGQLESVMDKLYPGDRDRPSQSELARMFDLIAQGKVTINDPELQKEAFDVSTKLKEIYAYEGQPEGYVPSYGYGGGEKSRSLYYEGLPVKEAVKKGTQEDK